MADLTQGPVSIDHVLDNQPTLQEVGPVPEMPQRPRSHQLETESRAALRRAIPSTWVIREVDGDYGIDAHVEIFTDEGAATGRSFLVQIKGSERRLRDSLAVRLKRSTENYLHEQDLPVLLVVHHAATDTLYKKWFHAFDPHYGREGGSTRVYRLDEARDRWTDMTPQDLLSDVEAFRLVRTRTLTLPIEVDLVVSDAVVNGVEAADLDYQFRSLARECQDIVSVVPRSSSPRPGHIRVAVSDTETVVNIGGAPTVTLHHSFEYGRENTRARVAPDVMMAISLWLGHWGEVNAAARLARTVASRSNVLVAPEAFFRVLGFFVRSHRVPEALELAEQLEKLDDDALTQLAPLIASVVALMNAEALSPAERDVVNAFLARRCRLAEERGDADEGRVAHYSLGNFLRGRDWPAAFHHYCRAAQLDPVYWERAYFVRELAGILFELGRYANAAHFYEASLELEHDNETRALHADALMFDGRYAESKAAFEAYLAGTSDPIAEFVLKAAALPMVIDRFGSVQARAVEQDDVHAALREDDDPQQVVEKMAAILDRDALNSAAWFNAGVALLKLDPVARRRQSFEAFLMAALTERGDAQAWANAFGLSLAVGEAGGLTPFVFDAAYRANEGVFIDRLRAGAYEQAEGFPVAEYLQVIEDLVEALPERRPRPTVRLVGRGAEVQELNLGRDPPDSR